MSNKNYLPYNAYVPMALDLEVGKSLRLFHCKTGHNNNKLYVTKQNDGVIVAFCHHCGAKGKYTPFDSSKVPIETVISNAVKFIKDTVNYGEVVEQDDFELPTTLEYVWTKWPPEARSWVLSCDITLKELSKHKLSYCTKLKRVIMPIYTTMGTLSGYISRKVFGDKEDSLPKYLMHKPEGMRLFKSCPAKAMCKPFEAVVVEDILSAIKCSRFLDSYAILGVNIPDLLIRKLSSYEHVFIYLDNDNDIVRQKQQELKHKLLSFVDKVTLLEYDTDPKAQSEFHLRRIFDDAT